MSIDRISRGLAQRQRRRAVIEGDTAKVEAIDKRLAAPAPPVAAREAGRDDQRRRLVGKGYDHLQGPEIAALRARMAAAASGDTPKPASAHQKIANGLKARKNPSRHDESFIPDWSSQGGIRRT